MVLLALATSQPPGARAQDRQTPGELATAIRRAEHSGTTFQAVTLFSAAPGRSQSALDNETLLVPQAEAIAHLYASRSEAVSLTLQTAAGQTYTLQLLASQPTAPTFRTGTLNAAGRHPDGATDDGLHYQGALAGDPHSLATLSVFASGEVMILFANGEGNFVLGRLDDGSGRYTLYNDQAFRNRPAMHCGVIDPPPTKASGLGGMAKTTAVVQCQKVRLYWECAYKVFQSKGSLAATRNYMTGLFNQVQAMYRNDRIAVELASLYVWTAPDDYTATSSGPVLDKFRNYWNGLSDGFDGDLAMYLSRDNGGNGGGNGGLAYLNVLCSRSFAYGYSDIYGTYQNIPTFSWDVEVITHELGHNLGSNHTHWCGWNTGAGGTCGAIDNCAAVEATSNCSSCSSTFQNSAPTTAWKGTVKSYCHLVNRGISLANGFGPLPAAAIQAEVATSACLSPVLTPVLTPSPICNGSGAVTLTWAANNFGTAPYTYLWNNGSTAQSLSSLSQPGTYTVTIKDSNNCTGSFSAAVGTSASPGDASTVAVMPVCCENTALTVPLRTTPPAGLSTCETIYWLRSPQPLSSVAVAKAYFDTTAASNIIPPSNPTGLAAGALLQVTPPAACTAPLTYYYTPVVASPPRTADSITYSTNASAMQPIYEGMTLVGGLLSLPDQQNQLSGCNPQTDTPQVQQLVLTVSNYTGRAGYLRISIQNAAGMVVYQAFGVAGNGSYVIPAAAIRGALLQDLTIMAVDYNCTSANNNFTCVSSSLALSAVRRVVYAARTARFGQGCRIGTPARIDFAPTACTRLAVGTDVTMNAGMTLAPNPATDEVRLEIPAGGASALQVTDAAGRLLLREPLAGLSGPQRHRFSVRGWPRGMYFVSVATPGHPMQRLKLIVE